MKKKKDEQTVEINMDNFVALMKNRDDKVMELEAKVRSLKNELKVTEGLYEEREKLLNEILSVKLTVPVVSHTIEHGYQK